MAQTRGRFEQIYDAHVVAIYRFIHARVGNRPDAEDLTAQVFMRAVEQLDTTRDEGQIVAWLYRVSQNAIADYWRAFYRLPLVGTEQVAPGWEPVAPGETNRDADQDVATRRVTALLRQARPPRRVRGADEVPDRYRQVLELRFLRRLSVEETARELGISHGNAKVLQYRALRKAALMDASTDG